MDAARSTLFFLFVVSLTQLGFCRGDAPKEISLCAELISPKGYTCSEHTVQTADGFLLGVQNIPYGVAGPGNAFRPPVLLHHGLSAGGDNWVANDPEESLAFILADAGFDVYIWNSRNTQWSHGSSKYAPSDPGYWDWTFDELSTYELPAVVEFVYKRTGSKVFYVGHSQGNLLLVTGLAGGGDAAMATKDMLKAGVLLAPAGYYSGITALLVATTFKFYADKILPLIGVGQYDSNIAVNVVCDINSAACSDVFTGFLGASNYINETRLSTYKKYYPQPTSSYNINHYGQLYRGGMLKKYDLGPPGNVQKYGQNTPPLYDLTKFPADQVPLQIFAGGIDQLSDPADVAKLLQQLPTTNREVITLPDYGHGDFIYGVRARVDVYPQLISFLRQHS